jgi:hypothetical protein
MSYGRLNIILISLFCHFSIVAQASLIGTAPAPKASNFCIIAMSPSQSQSSHQVKINIQVPADGVTPEWSLDQTSRARAAAEEVVNSVASILPNYRLPLELTFEMYPDNDGMKWRKKAGQIDSWAPDRDVVMIRSSMIDSTLRGYTRTVVAHEFTHVIFDILLREISESWNRHAFKLEEMAKLSRLSYEPWKQAQRLAYLRGRMWDMREMANLAYQFRKLIDQVNPLISQYNVLNEQLNANPPAIATLRPPYAELMSDLVELFYAENAQTVAATGSRDFQVQIDWTKLDSWTPVQYKGRPEEHHLFDPIRSWLWESHLKQDLTTPATKIRIAEHVLKAIMEEIKEIEAQGFLLMPDSDENARKMNLRLREILEKKL